MSKKQMNTSDEAYRSSMLPLWTGGIAGGALLVAGGFAAVYAYDNLTEDPPPAAVSTQDPSEPSSNPASPSDAPGDEDEDSQTKDRGDSGASDKKDDSTAPDEKATDKYRDGGDRSEIKRDSQGVAYDVREIVWGDTLSQISLETGISVDRLAEYNHIENPDLIYAGSALRVPSE